MTDLAGNGARHLVRRFGRSLRTGSLSVADEAWAAGFMTTREQALFAAMPVVDRRHAVDGGRLVAARLGGEARDAVEAAIIHDVGKRHSRLGILGRSTATVTGWFVRTDRRRRAWADTPGLRGRVGRYLRHDVVGADEVAAAGGSALAVAWTSDHHHPERFVTLPAPEEVVRALDDADQAS